MQVSVVVPVYNAAAFVREAVESALAQPEVAEVILVEDGSPDNSLIACQEIATSHERVHLYRHPHGENRGASASRNLGIEKSTCDYIAFLDADDFYMPGRFSVARRILEGSPDVDGVYEAIGTYFENDEVRRRWLETGIPLLTTVTQEIQPHELFQALITGGRGHFQLDGLVVRREIFQKTGPFDLDLRLHQDTALILKMAAVARLVPGRLTEPVAMRRVHGQNRIAARRPPAGIYADQMLLWETLWEWGKTNLDGRRRRKLLGAWLDAAMFSPRSAMPSWKPVRHVLARLQLIMFLREHPEVRREGLCWSRFLPRIGYHVSRLRARFHRR